MSPPTGGPGGDPGRPLPRDPGLQPERTVLAWRRTGLALLGAALAIGRLGYTTFGALVLAPTLVAAALALWLVLRADPPAPLRDGRVPAVMAGLAALLALGEACSALTHLP